MSEQNVVAFLRLLGERPDLLAALRAEPKERVIEAAGEHGLPFSDADFDALVWSLEARLAEARGDAFDQHFPLWQTMWGRYYLEVLVVDLVPSLLETRILAGSEATP